MGSNSTLNSKISKPIIFFDGVCNLCNRSINFIIDHDKEKRFLFAPLQGEKAKDILPKKVVEESDSVILFKDDTVYNKSTAALKIARQLNGFWPVLSIFIIIPKPIRDYIYSVIAKNRYKWFGKRDTCRFPEPDIEDRFLEKDKP